jgi:hypothetical protein
MKKLFILFTIISLSSCLGSRVTSKEFNTKNSKETTNQKKDSSNVSINKKSIIESEAAEINKYSGISLKTADSLANVKINKALRNFKYTERSGPNSTSARYDESTMQLIIETIVGATKNKETVELQKENVKVDSSYESVVETEHIIDKYVKKKIISMPWYLWLALYFLFIDSKFMGLLAGFIPQLKGAKTILNIIPLIFGKK